MKLGTKKDPNLEMCILQGESCLMFFEGVRALGHRIFYANYFVFASPPKPLGGICMKLGTQKDHNVEMYILEEECCLMFFEGVRALGYRIFYAKNFVFATPP